MELPFEIYFGPVVENEVVDWSALVDLDEPDDDEWRPTDPDVIDMLGFDPDEIFSEAEGGKKELFDWLKKGGAGHTKK